MNRELSIESLSEYYHESNCFDQWHGRYRHDLSNDNEVKPCVNFANGYFNTWVQVSNLH